MGLEFDRQIWDERQTLLLWKDRDRSHESQCHTRCMFLVLR